MTHLASAHVTAETDKKIRAFLYELAVVPNPELPSEPLDTGFIRALGIERILELQVHLTRTE